MVAPGQSGTPMLRFALTLLIVVVGATLFASSMLNGKLTINVPRPAAVAMQEQPAAAAPLPSQGSQSLDTVEIAPDAAGNYLTDIDIDGRTIRVVVDTGATYL